MKQQINEIKRLQQLAGIIVETKISPRDEYIKLKSIISNYFKDYKITSMETFEDEMDGDISNMFAYEIAKFKGFKGSFNDLVFDNEELNIECNQLAVRYLRRYADEIFISNFNFNETKVGPKQTSEQYVLKVLKDNGIDAEYLEDNDNEVEGGASEWLDVLTDITGKDPLNQEFTPEDNEKIMSFLDIMKKLGITML
jgi:hypothetical protein